MQAVDQLEDSEIEQLLPLRLSARDLVHRKNYAIGFWTDAIFSLRDPIFGNPCFSGTDDLSRFMRKSIRSVCSRFVDTEIVKMSSLCRI